MTYLASVGRVIVDTPTGQQRRVTGAAYDSNTQTLYLLYVHSGREISEDYDKPFHMVQVFQLGSGSSAGKRAAAMQSDGSDFAMQAAAAAGVPDEVQAQSQQQPQQQQEQAAVGDAATAAAAAEQPLRLKRRGL
jgi:hypothetical protein